MMEDNVRTAYLSFSEAHAFMAKVFEAAGVPKEDAHICADVLVESDKRGIDSHGLSRFKPVYLERIRQGILNPVTTIEIIRQGPTTAVLDAHHGMGMVAAVKAMEMAIEKARAYGMGMVAVRNSSHYGIAGYYATMATDAGMIGITGTNARPSVAPTFGVENLLGTNPLTFGMPSSDPFPFVLDCATSIAQRGKIETCARMDRPLSKGWVIDADGQFKSDPHQVLQDLISGHAALLPLGGAGEELAGYKGYGYSTVVEILSAALQGGRFLTMLSGIDQKGQNQPHGLGHFFIAIDIQAFTDVDAFKETAGKILSQLRNSKKAPGQDRIYTAGEKEYLACQHRKETGIPIHPSLQKELSEARDTYTLDHIRFPWDNHGI